MRWSRKRPLRVGADESAPGDKTKRLLLNPPGGPAFVSRENLVRGLLTPRPRPRLLAKAEAQQPRNQEQHTYAEPDSVRVEPKTCAPRVQGIVKFWAGSSGRNMRPADPRNRRIRAMGMFASWIARGLRANWENDALDVTHHGGLGEALQIMVGRGMGASVVGLDYGNGLGHTVLFVEVTRELAAEHSALRGQVGKVAAFDGAISQDDRECWKVGAEIADWIESYREAGVVQARHMLFNQSRSPAVPLRRTSKPVCWSTARFGAENSEGSFDGGGNNAPNAPPSGSNFFYESIGNPRENPAEPRLIAQIPPYTLPP